MDGRLPSPFPPVEENETDDAGEFENDFVSASTSFRLVSTFQTPDARKCYTARITKNTYLHPGGERVPDDENAK
jgi:hypothetical protein